MNIEKALKGLKETPEAPADLGGPPVDIEAGRERLREAARRLRDDPLEARRIDDLAKRIDRYEKDDQLGHQALQRQDFGKAEHYLRRAALHGNDEAAYWLAVILEMNSARQRLKGRPEKARELAAEARRWRLLAEESGLAAALDDTRDSDMQLPVAAQPRRPQRRQAGAPPRQDATGPPARQAPPGGDDRYVVGIELQPYQFTAVLVDGDGQIISDRAGDLTDMAPDAVVRVLAATAREIVKSALGQGSPAGQVALAVQLGGPVDTKTGTVHYFSKHPPGCPGGPSDFKWEGFPLGPRLQQETGFQTVVLNDAVAFAERELWFGVGRQTGDFVVMLLREGVGGAVVKNGEHFDGPVEIGNFRFRSVSFEQSDADQYGVLEVDGGTTGVAKAASENTGRSIPDIEAAAAAADEDGPDRAGASAAFLAAGVAIASGLSYLVQFAGPSHVVLYGPEVMVRPERRAGRVFLSQIKNFKEAVSFKAFRNCELVLRPAAANDGAEGAALAGLNRCFRVHPAASPVSTGVAR
jgi:predicted NBD/HSP70 family sugar kinase